MIKHSQDDNSEVLESPKAPAEALRQKQAYTIRHTAILAYKHGDITKLELEALLDKLCAAYAATVEREARKSELYKLMPSITVDGERLAARLAALQGPQEQDDTPAKH